MTPTNQNRLARRIITILVSFKYWEDRIVTSNMVAKLPRSPGRSFEDPELGILDGYKNPTSMKAYNS